MIAEKATYAKHVLIPKLQALLAFVWYNRYPFLRSVGVWMLMAFLVQLPQKPLYTVERAFKVQGTGAATSGLTVDAFLLQSKSAVLRAARELPWEVSYHADGLLGERELYGNELPVVVQVHETNAASAIKTLQLEVLDSRRFRLHDGSATATYTFGEVLRTPYATFSVQPGPAFSSDMPVLIRFTDKAKLAEAYAAKLKVKAVPGDISLLRLHLTDALPARGSDLINKLTELYSRGEISEEQSQNQSLRFIGLNLDSIQHRIWRLNVQVHEAEARVQFALDQQDAAADSAALALEALRSQREEYIQLQEDYLNRKENIHYKQAAAILHVQQAEGEELEVSRQLRVGGYLLALLLGLAMPVLIMKFLPD